MESFLNVQISVTPAGGTKVSTDVLFDLSGLGSSRSVDKKKCLNEQTLLSVGRKEYETLSFSLPYSETSSGFHDTCVGAYDANKLIAIEIEFDNAITVGGTGTKMSGNGKLISYKPKNDNDSIVSDFSIDWEGSPALTKAN